MSGVMSYGALATKIRGMKSHLLKEKDFENLAQMENVSQAIAYLEQIPSYRIVLEKQDAAKLHRSELERLVVGTLYYDFTKLYRFCDKKQKKLLELYFGKFEISVIKRALRRIFNHGDRTGESRELRGFFQKLSNIHMEELSQAGTISELLEALRDTRYKKVLLRLDYGREITLFDYEMTLDLYYFSELWKQKDKIDLLNLTWISRAKRYYQLPTTSVFALVIPVTYHLRDEEIQAMATASDEKELEEILARTYYGRRFEEVAAGELEKLNRQLLNRIYGEERRKNPYSLAVVTSYLHDKEEEIDKLTTVLEGVRYGLEPRETLAYIRG